MEVPVVARSPSLGASNDSKLIEERLQSMRALLSSSASAVAEIKSESTRGLQVPEQLAVKNAAFKRMTATVAMYLSAEWRTDLLRSIDRLLDPDDWDTEFQLPFERSFSTFLRMIIYLHPSKRPGLGLSPSGNFLAAWSRNTDRIVIESLADDEVRWVISRTVMGERESGAGKVQIHRVPDVIAPYDPESLFSDVDKILI